MMIASFIDVFFPRERGKKKVFGGILTAMFESWRVNQASLWEYHASDHGKIMGHPLVMSTKTNNVTAIDGALSSMIYFSI